MNRLVCDDEEVPVEGFEIPNSPDSSYDNVYEFDEDEKKKDIPTLPPHLPLKMIKKCPPNLDPSDPLQVPLKISLNHVYIDSTKASSSVVGVGLTHRYRSKFVTVVLYKPVAPAPAPPPPGSA